MVVVLGHRGMLGRRVMETFPDAETIEARSTGTLHDPLLAELERLDPEWVIDCAGATADEPDLWAVNAVLPHRIAARWRLIYPSTDHITDDTEYARSKRLGECGVVIRCAIVDPDGGMLARCRTEDTFGEVHREWNGITARTWARLAERVVAGELDGLIRPGSPTISHYQLQATARDVFGWWTQTIPDEFRVWKAPRPDLLMPPIAEQLREYL